MADDLVEIALRHRNLLDRILTKSTGAIGEIIVADKLTEQGYHVEPTNNNAEQNDLMIHTPDGREIGIEVKTSRDKRPTWFVRTCPNPAHSQIWCFVSAPRSPTALPNLSDVEIYVLTTEEAAQIWNASDWNKRNPQNGDIRRHQIPDDARDAWSKLDGVKSSRWLGDVSS